jgi:hypothetical protein
MNSFSLANSLLVSVRIYRAMLVAYPQKFREHYETQLVQVFRDSLRYEYNRHGLSGVIDLWLHTFADLLVTALIERIMERSQYMFSPKVILWGGVASVFAGLFWLMTGLAPSSGDATLMFALVLSLGGLVGLYSQQARQGGILGLAGFVLGIISTVAMLVADWIDPDLSGTRGILIISLFFLTLGIGLALLGIASLRGKTLPRWWGLPLTLGLLNILQSISFWLIFYVPLSHGQDPFHPWNLGNYGLVVVFALMVLIGIGWIALGATLATEGGAQIPVSQPPSASA